MLCHIPVSHYSDKARWALDYKRIPHTRRWPAGGLHPIVTWLLTEGRDPAERRRALGLEDYFDEELGPYVRRMAYHHMTTDPELLGELAAHQVQYGIDAFEPFTKWTLKQFLTCASRPAAPTALGMHQDGSYAGYLSPPEMITCWVALDETFAQGGTIEYVRGSHLWPKAPPERDSFHAPDDWLAPLAKAAPEGATIERVPVVVKPGGCAFHHSLTFHGSGPNESEVERRALVSHLVPVETRFHPDNTDLIYSRYRRRGDLSLDESFFPVLWDENGGRSAWLEGLPSLPA
jgi:hypothetical protein